MADRNGYIGRAPADSSVAVARQIFSPTGVQTNFTFASGYDVGYLDLYLNGIRLIEGQDYNATDTSTVGLTSFAQNGDILEAVAYKAFNLGDVERIGIQSAGTLIGNARILNFVGTGNTFALNGTTIDVSISGGAGAGGTWATYDSNTGITTSKKVRVQNDVEVTGVATFSSNVTVGGVLTYDDVTNVDSVGLITARNGIDVTGGNVTIGTGSTVGFGSTAYFRDNAKAVFGDGEDLEIYHDLTNSIIENNKGELQLITTNPGTSIILQSTSDVLLKVQNSESAINAYSNGSVELFYDNSKKFETTSAGVTITGIATADFFYGDGSNLTNLPAAGISTEAGTASGIVTHVRLSSAQDHKITATGFTTITSSGSGTEGESHTIRIVNSGIATVGFSTYFLFPSGAAPTLPTADGAISLISFTVHDSVGAGCTQLLAGASVNYS
jgi:hypothetical protein